MNNASKYLIHDHICTQVARHYSNEQGRPYLVSVGDYRGFDIQSAEGDVRIEVKVDSTSIRTHSIALEYWNTELDLPSGILATEATLWLHIVSRLTGWEAHEYDIANVRRLAIEAGVFKSNGRNALLRIVPLAIARQYTRRSFPFTPLSAIN